MNDYWLLLPTVVVGLVALAFALLWWHDRKLWRLTQFARDYFKQTLGAQQDHIKRVEQERDEARLQHDKLNTENANLREALQEKIAEIKALQMNTVEVQEVAKRPARAKKAGTQ